ncbi:hypothetical protein D3C81_2052650 [compost metagenome]
MEKREYFTNAPILLFSPSRSAGSFVSNVTLPPKPPFPTSTLCGPLSTVIFFRISGSIKTEPCRYLSKLLTESSKVIGTSATPPRPRILMVCPPGRGDPAELTLGM